MATALASPKGNAAMRKYLREVAQRMRAGVAPHDATGALGASISQELTEIARSGATGRITALDYWVNVGSGTPPGTFVSVEALVKWVKAKGIRSTDRGAILFATRVSYRIEEAGSRDFRRGGKNVFLTAIEASQGDTDAVVNAYVDDLDDATLRLFIAQQRA